MNTTRNILDQVEVLLVGCRLDLFDLRPGLVVSWKWDAAFLSAERVAIYKGIRPVGEIILVNKKIMIRVLDYPIWIIDPSHLLLKEDRRMYFALAPQK